MSELDVDTLAALLSADLALPHRAVRWACPFGFGAGLTSALRRASRALAEEPRGGLLVVHIERGRGTPEPARAQAALLAALDRVQITDIHSVLCADGLAIACVLAPALRLTSTGDRAPVAGAALTALRSDAPARLAPLVRLAERCTSGEGLTPDEQILVAAGAATLCEDAIVPTVAGLVAFGSEPAAFLGGLHAIIEGDRTLQVSGDPISLARRTSEALGLVDAAASLLQALVLRALLDRTWLTRLDDEPLTLLVTGRRIELRWPSFGSEDSPANPILRRLLRARAVSSVAFEAPERLSRWFEHHGGVLLVERDGDETIARAHLPRAPSAATSPMPAGRPLAPAKREPVSGCSPPPPDPAPPEPASEIVPPPHVPADVRAIAALALFEDGAILSARDVMQALGWSRSTTRDVLARLVGAGALFGTAPSARSPHQTYTRPTVGPGR